MSKDELMDVYEKVLLEKEQVESVESVIKDILFDSMDADSEEIGEFQVTKVTRLGFTKFPMERATELGAVKNALDTTMLKNLYNQGALTDFEPSISQYIAIRRVKHDGDEQE